MPVPSVAELSEQNTVESIQAKGHPHPSLEASLA